MNPYLAALVRSPYSPRFGDISLARTTPDAATQPPRLYAAFSSRGGILHDEEAAKTLRGAGYSVVRDNLNAEEHAWLQANARTWQGKPPVGWFFSCEGTDTREGGSWICRNSGSSGATEDPGAVVTQQSLAEARSDDLVSRADLLPIAEAMGVRPNQLPSNLNIQYVGGTGTGGYTNPQFAAALGAVQAWYSMGRGLSRLASAEKAGVTLSPSARAVMTRGYRVRAKYAQPVSQFVAENPQYKEDERYEAAQFGLVPAAAVPFWAAFVKPAIFLGATVIFCGTIVYAVRMLAGSAPEIQEANNLVWNENTKTTEGLRNCAAGSQGEGIFARRICERALRTERGQVPSMGSPAGDFADIAKYTGVGIAAIAGIYLLGPFVKTFAEGARERGQARRQRRAIERQDQKLLAGPKKQVFDAQFEVIDAA